MAKAAYESSSTGDRPGLRAHKPTFGAFMKKLVSAPAVAVLLSACAGMKTSTPAAMGAASSTSTVMVGGAPMYPNKDIVDNAVNSKDHTTLVAAVKAAGLVDTLKSPGPFTVFAPTNAAFD